MVGDTKQAASATTAVIFITVGALMAVWSTVYYFYLTRHEVSDIAYVWCYGFFFSGLVLVVIGLGLGHIAKAVRPAEVAKGPAPGAPVSPPATPAGPVVAATPTQAQGPVRVAQTQQ
jgi:hypothetical protein